MGRYSNSHYKFTLFDIVIPPEYFVQVTDILNDIMRKYNMSKEDIEKLGPMFEDKNEEYVGEFPQSMNDNFFDELFMRRNDGIRAAKSFIDEQLKDFEEV